jgi:predicted anti-sigma-YlaC factor YlaD
MKDIFEKNCSVVFDLLPLYADESCSARTAELIRHHLLSCKRCRNFLHSIKSPAGKASSGDIPASTPDYLSISKRLKRRRAVKNTLLTISAISAVAAPIAIYAYMTYGKDTEDAE